MADKVFVSPGVYTSENDLTFVTRQVGVTTLGVVGETTQGPAFQPIFVRNYDEFRNFFGGLNATKVKDTGAPKYELPYIAKSYLSESNQLFVTRVLGFSGFDGGLSWGITLDSGLDSTTIVETQASTDYDPLITFSATSDGLISSVVSADSVVQTLFDDGLLDTDLSFLPTSVTGTSVSIGQKFTKTGSQFVGASMDLYVTSTTTDVDGNISGTASGTTIQYTGEGYSDVDNKIVALLKSRAKYDGDEILNFDIENSSDINFNSTATDASSDPKGDFTLEGTSSNSGAFSYSLSFDRN